MKNFIKKQLREDLESYYGVSGDVTKDKFKLGIKEYEEDYDDDGEYYGDEDDDFNIGNIETSKPTEISNQIIAYHGSPNKISKFQDAFVGGKEAKDQEGPGIYFTKSKEEAHGYAGKGGFVCKVILKPKKFVSTDLSHDLDYLTNTVTKLIKTSGNWERVAKGYDDGLDDMVSKYISTSQTERDVFISLFNDVYQNDPINYVRNMVKLGYQGIYFPANEGHADHIVVYDPSIIKINN